MLSYKHYSKLFNYTSTYMYMYVVYLWLCWAGIVCVNHCSSVHFKNKIYRYDTCTSYDTLEPDKVPQTIWKYHILDYPTVMGFEPLVNQRLLPPTFPRYARVRSRTETIEYLENLTNRLKHVCSVVDTNMLHNTMVSHVLFLHLPHIDIIHVYMYFDFFFIVKCVITYLLL